MLHRNFFSNLISVVRVGYIYLYSYKGIYSYMITIYCCKLLSAFVARTLSEDSENLLVKFLFWSKSKECTGYCVVKCSMSPEV